MTKSNEIIICSNKTPMVVKYILNGIESNELIIQNVLHIYVD